MQLLKQWECDLTPALENRKGCFGSQGQFCAAWTFQGAGGELVPAVNPPTSPFLQSMGCTSSSIIVRVVTHFPAGICVWPMEYCGINSKHNAYSLYVPPGFFWVFFPISLTEETDYCWGNCTVGSLEILARLSLCLWWGPSLSWSEELLFGEGVEEDSSCLQLFSWKMQRTNSWRQLFWDLQCLPSSQR